MTNFITALADKLFISMGKATHLPVVGYIYFVTQLGSEFSIGKFFIVGCFGGFSCLKKLLFLLGMLALAFLTFGAQGSLVAEG